MVRRTNIFTRPHAPLSTRWPWGSREWEACTAQVSAAVVYEQYCNARDRGEIVHAARYQAIAAELYARARRVMGIESRGAGG